jgi:hypothetical protein
MKIKEITKLLGGKVWKLYTNLEQEKLQKQEQH